MSTRKSPSKASSRPVRSKLARDKEEPVFPLELKYARVVKVRSAKKSSGIKTVRVWGNFDDVANELDGKKVPRMPNPLPDNKSRCSSWPARLAGSRSRLLLTSIC